MYQEVFNFNSRPFTSNPYVNHYCALGSVRDSLEQIELVMDRDAGPTVVVGKHGMGKSLLLELLADRYQEKFRVVPLTCGPMTERRDMLQAILFQLDQPYRDLSEGELRLSLIDFIKPTDKCPNGILLLVDDAQSLTADLVDELRLVTNFVRDGVPRVRLVLAGTSALEELLTEPKLEPFNQRVAARCFLESLKQEETHAYIQKHIGRAGGDAEKMFERATTEAIHDLTQGCPRFVNQLCEQSMILAATRGMLVVEPDLVSVGWARVQGLPVPSEVAPADTTVTVSDDQEWTVIEFGSLDDDESDVLGAATESLPNQEHDAVDQQTAAVTFADHGDSSVDDLVQPGAEEDAFQYQPPASQDDLSEPASESPQSIPTEIQSLYDDQQATWEAAEQSTETGSGSPSDASELLDPAVEVDALQGVAGDQEDQPVENVMDSESVMAAFASATPAEVTEPAAELVAELESEPGEVLQASGDGGQISNPFDEAFEAEEAVADGFSQFIANQNVSSLEVRDEELGYLEPLAAVDSIEREEISALAAFGESEGVAQEYYIEPHAAQTDLLGESTVSHTEPLDTAASFPDEPVAEPAAEFVVGDASTGQDLDSPGLTEPEATAMPLTNPGAELNGVPFSQSPDPQEAVTDDSTMKGAVTEDTATVEAVQEVSDETNPATYDRLTEIMSSLGATAPTDAASEPDTGMVAGQSFDQFDGNEAPAEAIGSSSLIETDDSTGADYPPHSPLAGSYHEHVEHAPTDDIQQAADEILQSIQPLGEPDSEPDELLHPTDELLSPSPLEATGPNDEADENPELTDTQQILSEILEQKSLLSGQQLAADHSAVSDDLPASVPMIQPVPEESTASGVSDDSDMIVVSEMVDGVPPLGSAPQNAGEPQSQSIGRVERMDYERLFEQLRNSTD